MSGGQVNHWRQSIIDTLDLCLLRLPSTIHAKYIERINLIKSWLGSDISPVALQPTSAVEPILNWTEQEAINTAETAHGQAIIVELPTSHSPYLIGHTSTYYRARILHNTGALLESQEQFATFEQADTWIRTMVTRLDNPLLEEANLESIRFTLAICKRVLPDDANPVHLANLQLLEEILVEALL
jgi:hypothetical protein